MKFQNFKITLITFIIISLFSGCISSFKPKKVDNSLPSWYMNAPSNTVKYIYGEGEGLTLKEAKENALNSMASKLVVSVQSSIQTTTKTSRTSVSSSYSKDVKNRLKIDVQKIKFTNAIVENNSHKGDTFYILMKVDRINLFNQKNKEFEVVDQILAQKFNSLDKYSVLEKIKILQNMYPKVIAAKNQVVILNAINNDFDSGKYIIKYDKYVNEINNLKDQSIIYITTNNQKRYFADSLIDMLNQNNYKIGTKDKKNIEIKIINKVKYSKARGWNIAKVSTTLSVISDNKIISNRIISTVGRSSTSKESALENAANIFTKKIKKETLDKVIFGK